MNQRRFGVEIECGGRGGIRGAIRILRDAGLHHWAETDEGENVRNDIHADGSGVEIPSPILQGRRGFRELKQVMQLLRDNGYRTGTADGMHVHHEAPEWMNNPPLIAHTIELWEENLPLIRRFVDSYRTTHSYACSSYRIMDGEASSWEMFKHTKNLEDLNVSRTRALNMTGVLGRNHPQGTVEIRLHEGTLDYNKAAAWVRFGQAFLDFALETFQTGTILTCASRTDLLRHVRVSNVTRQFLLAANPSPAVRDPQRGVFVVA